MEFIRNLFTSMVHNRRLFIEETSLSNSVSIQMKRGDGVVSLKTCPVCGFPGLESRNSFEICKVCFWEDDGQEECEAELVCGGPNGDLSIITYRSAIANELITYINQENDLFCKDKLEQLFQIESMEQGVEYDEYKRLILEITQYVDSLWDSGKLNVI